MSPSRMPKETRPGISGRVRNDAPQKISSDIPGESHLRIWRSGLG
jgi:hypothetical protein